MLPQKNLGRSYETETEAEARLGHTPPLFVSIEEQIEVSGRSLEVTEDTNVTKRLKINEVTSTFQQMRCFLLRLSVQT